MAPRKEKAEKATADQGCLHTLSYKASSDDIAKLRHAGNAMIIDYLKKENRPYSATEISANLHNKVTKTYATKALKELHEQNIIAGKAAGKQIVYHAIQKPSDSATPEEVAAMEKEIGTLRQEIADTKSREKILKAELISINATMSTHDLQASITSLDLEKKKILARLGPLKEGNVKPISVEEKEKVDKEHKKWSKRSLARKKICMELWEICTEVLEEGKTKEDLWEELGLEADE